MLLICGPCSAESQLQLYNTAKAMQSLNIDFFRAGLWKPRTRPVDFEGVGDAGLSWMRQIKSDFNYKICTEVASVSMIEKCLRNDFDAMWVGARTVQSPFLIEELACALEGCDDITVMIKNPLNPDVKLWLGAIERFEKHGVKNIVAIHRGFSVTYSRYRYAPLWRIPIELKRLRKDLKIICDPSHISGDKNRVKEIAFNAVTTGFDGLMIETHISPQTALTDSFQQLDIRQLEDLLQHLPFINNKETDKDDRWLLSYREQIDDVDDIIIDALADRMEIARKIAEIKKNKNLTVFQPDRWTDVLARLEKRASDKGINPLFLKELYSVIHQESINEQNIIINKSNDYNEVR